MSDYSIEDLKQLLSVSNVDDYLSLSIQKKNQLYDEIIDLTKTVQNKQLMGFLNFFNEVLDDEEKQYAKHMSSNTHRPSCDFPKLFELKSGNNDEQHLANFVTQFEMYINVSNIMTESYTKCECTNENIIKIHETVSDSAIIDRLNNIELSEEVIEPVLEGVKSLSDIHIDIVSEKYNADKKEFKYTLEIYKHMTDTTQPVMSVDEIKDVLLVKLGDFKDICDVLQLKKDEIQECKTTLEAFKLKGMNVDSAITPLDEQHLEIDTQWKLNVNSLVEFKNNIVELVDAMNKDVEKYRPVKQDDVPNVDGDAPNVDGDAPNVDGDAPNVDGDVPNVDGDADGAVPKVDGN
jgi:hypothetical protein